MSKLRVIKKYPNRRRYDTKLSRCVTIEDLKQLIVKLEATAVLARI
ncbi:MAG: polyhydroxyalkanoate synthesis regulator DNA-binding domain-containing protein [Gammaproteobacteria bacterium]|nr:polyhydroxyalkanoate synthesis regulator DNA-binding domain-containing protein [Gammaproteobacteria bacterium]